MWSSGIAAEALPQPVAVETVEQHFSVKGSNKQTESVLFAPLIETRAKPGSIPGLDCFSPKRLNKNEVFFASLTSTRWPATLPGVLCDS